MGAVKVQAITLMFLINVEYSCCSEFLRVCTFPSMSVLLTGIPQFDMENIDPTLCTHLIYASGRVDNTTNTLRANQPDDEEFTGGRYSVFNNLKRCDHYYRTLLSVSGPEGFMSVTDTDETIEGFSKQAVKFVRDRGFDGMDIDWRYPTTESKSRFVMLLKNLRKYIDLDRVLPKLLLTLNAPADRLDLEDLYNVPEIKKIVDYIILRTYNFTSDAINVTHFRSPLFPSNNSEISRHLNMNYSVHLWNSLGMPFDKMLVGVSGSGVRQVLRSTKQTSVGSPIIADDKRDGPYYHWNGVLAYPEICEILSLSSTKKFFDENQKSPYLVSGDEWIGYEDKRSLKIKISWMKQLGVAGVFFSSLDEDDFRDKLCGEGKYPLLRAIKEFTMEGFSSTSRDSLAKGSTKIATSSSNESKKMWAEIVIVLYASIL